MDKYAAEILLERDDEYEEGCNYDEYHVLSSIQHISDYLDFRYDIFNYLAKEEEIKKLEKGHYVVFIIGEAEFESDVDWESGIEEGHFIYSIDEIFVNNDLEYPHENRTFKLGE